MKSYSRTGLLTVLALLAPAVLQAQEPTQVPPELQSVIVEAQQIEQRLAPIEERVMQDPELQAEQEEVSLQVRTAMLEADPTLETQALRMQELHAEVQEAQAEGDADRLGVLMGEVDEIQQNVSATQAEVMEQPEIADRVEAFQTRVHARMIEEDPEAETLLQRLHEIREEVDNLTSSPGL